MSSSGGRFAQIFLRYAGPFAELRRLPVVGPVLRWIASKLVPRGTLTWIQVEGGPAAGLWLKVNPRTGHLYLEGGGEVAVQQALADHLRAGMTFYDLGANIGFFSLLAARIVGSQGRVVAFEADPEVASRLREHVARNNFPWITVEQKAVWSEPGTLSFARVDPGASPDRGQGHVSVESGAECISVEAVSLDQYTGAAASPDFIKCDVEGAEVEMFRGARRLLEQKRPIVLIEMHSPENTALLSREFAALGYHCLDCDPTHVLALPR
jgi:FkbM family methyltransferase